MNEEIWKDVVGYEGVYQVSNVGRVKSMSRISSNGYCASFLSKEKILKNITRTQGYMAVSLCINSKPKSLLVHRLMAIAFMPAIEGKEFVNHINGTKSDNRLENLEWVNKRENGSHYSCTMKKKTSSYVGVYWAKYKWRATITMNDKVRHIGMFDSEEDAALAHKNYIIDNNLTDKYSTSQI